MSPAAAMGLAVLLPLAAVPLILLLRGRPNAREAVSLLAGAALLATVLPLAGAPARGVGAPLVWAEPIPGLALAFALEPLGALFALLAAALWIVTTVYSIGYMRGRHERHQTRFYAWFAVAIASTMGIAFAANMLTLFVFYEALTLSTFPLVTHAGTEQARRAGRTYLGLLMGTSTVLLLLAVVWTWRLAGTLDFQPGGILAGRIGTGAAGLLLALYVLGIGKAALMPLHRWLPAAMVAPTPVSALLHAVAVVKAGVFTVLKVVLYVFGPGLLSGVDVTLALAYLAAITLVVAAVEAIRQDNLKARLAYSTISQLAYIVLGALLLNGSALVGAGLHMVTHAFGKITLFFCAGAILVASGKTRVSELAGLGRAQPVTMGAFLVASLSIIGLPPGGGVWSKWLLAAGTLEAGQAALLGVLLLGSLLSAAYLMPIPLKAFFQKGDAAPGIREAPLPTLIAIGVTALGCLALFAYPEPLYRLAEGMLTR